MFKLLHKMKQITGLTPANRRVTTDIKNIKRIQNNF